MPNFRSLNSSKSNLQSVKDQSENAVNSAQNLTKEKKDSAFNKYNINGEKRRGEGEGGH